MANWPVHSRDAIGYGAIVLAAVGGMPYMLDPIDPTTAWAQAVLVMAICGTVMVVFPDADHHNSRPRRYLMTITLVAAGGLAVWAILGTPHQRLTDAVQMIDFGVDAALLATVVIIGIVAAGVYAFGQFVDGLSHRGPTHGLPGMALGAVVTGGVVFYLMPPGELRWIATGMGAVVGAGGVLVHRLRDWVS